MWSNNIKFYCTFFLLLYGLLYSTSIFCANNSVKSKKTIVFDSSKIEVRQLNVSEQQKLLSDKDYKYDKIGPEPKSLWERLKEWFWRRVDELLDTKGGSIALNILKYILIIVAIVLIVFLLLKNDIRALFYGKSASIPIDFKEFNDDIHKINFNELIANALSEKDFKRAVRLHFLKLLKELTDKNLISWKIDKTNNDYLMELANSRYNKHFKELAISYEYIWYGDFQLDETNFKITLEKFKLFEI
jgi:hypothetical protein